MHPYPCSLKPFKILLLAIISLSYTPVSAQSFDSLIAKARASYNKKDYVASIGYFEKAFQLSNKVAPHDYYNAACSYSLAGQIGQAARYLEKSLEHEKPVTIGHLMKDPDLEALRKSADFNKIITKSYSAIDSKFFLSKEISWASLLEYIKSKAEEGEKSLYVFDKIIYWKKEGKGFVYNQDPPEESLKAYPELSINFSNCDFPMAFMLGLGFENRETTAFKEFSFDKCNFRGPFVLGQRAFSNYYGMNAAPRFTECIFQYLDLNVNILKGSDRVYVYFDRCQFGKRSSVSLRSLIPLNLSFNENIFSKDSSLLSIVGSAINELEFDGNSFERNGSVRVNADEVKRVFLTNNTFHNFVFDETTISSKFSLVNSSVRGKFLFRDTSFPDPPNSSISWEGFSELKLGIFEYFKDDNFKFNVYPDGNWEPVHYKQLPVFVSGEKDEDIADGIRHKNLMSLYSQFLEQFKAQNDLESYNSCFITMKELQSKRLKYLYQSNKSFESYFRWKLSQLLRIYVRYGTDPARAIVISLYIIFIFGVFFFFFPSDWDVTSKPKMLRNFKDFIQKNEKGYIKPFFILLAGFGLSMLNALTLSLNAFITLGFGNIPTHGLARYFCVLEGFLGWFLLSIFTVAMINQVL